jgi:hypothetical protein
VSENVRGRGEVGREDRFGDNQLAVRGIHLTGLFLLSGHLTKDNVEPLLGEARGKSKRQLEELLARCFPRPDVAPTLSPLASAPVTRPGTGGAAPREKLEQAWNLLRHAIPRVISPRSSSGPSTS